MVLFLLLCSYTSVSFLEVYLTASAVAGLVSERLHGSHGSLPGRMSVLVQGQERSYRGGPGRGRANFDFAGLHEKSLQPLENKERTVVSYLIASGSKMSKRLC
uniref:Uncharacterized protein n=1 Tax=Sphaerodactylus townsendi TaxID=933632 RepID=A0ACB8FFL1_9SAUR